MNNNLKHELEKFWTWAGITSQEYAAGKVPEKAVQAEWEGEYPKWYELEKAVDEEIKLYEDDLSDERASLILEALAVDNESETILEKLMDRLEIKALTHLSNKGSKFFISNARWQITELLKKINVPNRKRILEEMIRGDKDKYVQRRALLSLSSLAPSRSEKYAYEKITDDDEYLRLVSLRILKEQKSGVLKLAKATLKDDSSSLIQKELASVE